MNKKSYYGAFGGQYVAESLMNTLKELDDAFEKYTKDEEFLKEVDYYLKQYVGRETPLYFASRLSEAYGTKIYLKREDLNHTGAHKINRSDSSGKENGKNQGNRRNRSRSAWCGNCNRSSSF